MFVKRAKRPLPYLSLGAGSMSFTWKQQAELMKAFRASRNAFMSQFYWGGSDFVGLPRPLAEQLTAITLAAVAVSIILHGISVRPMMRLYWKRMMKAVL